MLIHRVTVLVAAAFAFASHGEAAPEPSPTPPPRIEINDNRSPAGILADGALTLELRAGTGVWHPEGASSPGRVVQAFGAGDRPLSVPAPLIRVPEGTEISVSIRNDLADVLHVHGLCARGGSACAPITVAPGETGYAHFVTGPAGTYHYWGSTTGMPFTFRAADDSQLSGAFVVDPPGTPPGWDRVFVITEWVGVTRAQLKDLLAQDDPGAAFLKLKPDVLFTINGLAWPHSERLTYRLGERVRWRVINLSTQVHPMHLHGFYFEIEGAGNGARDAAFAPGSRPRVVTHLMQPGATLGLAWIPERPGNWLFHCHVMTHVSPVLHVDGSPKPGAGDGHGAHDPGAGMIGMVLGVTVLGSEEAEPAAAESARTPRALTLDIRSETGRFGSEPAYGFVLAGNDTPSALPIPGPTLVLTRGESVEITLRNHLPVGTAIHWHGMELDSYYDGVHGWSGAGLRVTPLIEPGGSFVVRFTPPRAGTFMYHTHLHDHRQLTSGLYGGMVVVEPGETFDERTDHVLVLGRHGPQADAPLVINGEKTPKLVWKAAARHRLRLANITPGDTVVVSLRSKTGPITWFPLAKDAAPVPPGMDRACTAEQPIGVGEIYDFEIDLPAGRQTLWLEVRSPGGRWHAQAQVIVR